MKYIGELMANLGRVDSNRDYDEEKCKVCGATIRFYQNEYKKPCRECGTWIYQGFKAKKSHETRVKCFICMDKGIVEYTVQKRGILYKHVARCDCPKG
ncbi:MAG TPA: hypothetical protein VFD57_02555, partial [Clostridia bacterium]|nr:hypothetical protein [Clostridia bacterium]